MLKKLQKIILPKQREINRGLQLVQGGLVFVWAMVWWQVLQWPTKVLEFSQLGKLLGVLSLVLFCVTLLPGIFTRLQVWKTVTSPVATLIAPFRRNLGILMFISAFVHMSLSSTLPYVALELSQLRTFLPLSWSGRIAYVIGVLPPPTSSL